MKPHLYSTRSIFDSLRNTLKPLSTHYALLVLSAINLFYYADRFVIFMLVEPIKADLGLTDGQMGLITGAAFAISYVALAIPVGLMTDRVNRVRLLALSVTVWCSFTALCGLAKNYWQLIVYRVGVATGEAGGFIPAQSLVADSYPPDSRGRAMAVFLCSANLGKIVAFMAAGMLNEIVGWRWTFAIIGTTGLFLGPLLFLTVREPVRGGMDFKPPGDAEQGEIQVLKPPPLRTALTVLLQRRSFVCLLAGYAVAAIAHYSMLSWLPTFFIRRFDFSTGEAGVVVSTAIIVPGLIGMVLGGMISDKLFKRDPKWAARVPAIALILACPTLIMQVYSPSLLTVILIGLVPSLAVGMYAPPLLAGIQAVSGARMRGIGGSLLMTCLLLVGQGFGPSISGLLSDYFSYQNTAADSHASLRSALAVISLFYAVGGWLLYRGGTSVKHDIELANQYDRGVSAPV